MDVRELPPIRLTRRVTFSSGHRYWLETLSREENLALFGPIASPHNHGHNYILDATVAGRVDPRTGMVINIKLVDDVLKDRAVSKLHNRSLNDEVDMLSGRTPCLENLLVAIASELTGSDELGDAAHFTHLRLEEMPTLWAELNLESGNAMTLTRLYEFAASHRLHSPMLTDEENVALFGKCNNPAGHGHNYVVEVTVGGDQDPRTGMIVDLDALDAKVNELVIDRYDHKNLNEDLPEFQGGLTSSEVLVAEIFRRLDGQLPARLVRVRVHETARNIFEVSA